MDTPFRSSCQIAIEVSDLAQAEADGTARAMKAMLQMKKIDIEALRRAFEGTA